MPIWGLRATPRLVFRVLGRAASNFADDRGTQMAAAISYYTLFSLFPLTLLAVSIFGVVLRSPEVQGRVLNAIIAFLPIQDESIAESLRSVADLGPTLTIISLLGSLWSGGAVSASIRSALNVVFEVKRRRPLLRGKLIDFALLPIIGLPLLGGVVLTAVWRLAQEEVTARLGVVGGAVPLAWNLGATLIPLTLSFAAFLLTYWLVPHGQQKFRYIWPGALLAALAFEGLKAGFATYLEYFGNYDVIYGSLGSVIILLFWVYLTAVIVIFGGEVASEVPHVIHEEPRHGSRPEGNWRTAVVAVLRGLVMAGEDETPEEQQGQSRRSPPPSSETT